MQKYPVSKIAASSAILAINIFKLREKFIQKFSSKNDDAAAATTPKDDRFFKSVEGERADPSILFYLNTDIWNNKEVHTLTGYSIEEIAETLLSLAKFVSENLVPNKLKYFDILALQEIRNDESIP